MLFIHSVLFLMLVATIVAQTGVPRIRYRVDQWTISVETPQSYESEEIHPYESEEIHPYESEEIHPYESEEIHPYESEEIHPFESEEIHPFESEEIHPFESDKKSLGADEQGELTESPVWFLFLVVPMVLLTAMGALAVGYYLCVWRGGRIGYRPSRDLLTNF